MAPAETPEKLWELALECRESGIRGMLISGGSDRHGAVPVLPYLDIINKIKTHLNISINLHTGLIGIDDIPELRGKGVDMVSFDIVGSLTAMKNVYGLEVEPDYFDNALDAFQEAGIRVVPHITVGLDRGNDSGEESALKMLSHHDIDHVVFNAIMSSEGSEKAGLRLLEILPLARKILPERISMGIGCMRPRNVTIDAELISELGIGAMALPNKSLVRQLKHNGIDIVERDGCCAFFRD